jgi:hypothetical protein
MRENRTYGSDGGGTETNRFSLPLSGKLFPAARLRDSQLEYLPPALAGGYLTFDQGEPASAGLHWWLQPGKKLRDGKSG